VPPGNASAKGGHGPDTRDISAAEQKAIEARTAQILKAKAARGTAVPKGALAAATVPVYVNVMRDAVDKYYADTGKYPERLDVLVAARYLRKVPVDPVTDSTETWVVIPPADPQKSGVNDIRSGAQGVGMDGKPVQQAQNQISQAAVPR